MPVLASSVLAETRGLLNDVNGNIYQTTPMYVLMNKCYRELQNKLTTHGIGTTKEVSTEITVPANTTQLVEGDGMLPADFLRPKYLKERRSTSDQYVDIDQKDWEPLNLQPKDYIGYWVWREDTIKLSPSTIARLVLLQYIKGLTAIDGPNVPIQINGAEQWLAQRTASIAALVIGGNPTRSAALAVDLVPIWDDFIITAVKQRQGRRVRRRVSRYRARH